MNKFLVLLSLLLRISVAIFTRTFFQPDEYFQCLEPAHKLAFGYGHLTWEWVSSRPIRTIAFPALWASVYKVLLWTHLDSTNLIILAPKLAMGVVGALTDIFLYKLTSRLIGEAYSPVALFLSLTSFFHSLALTRTLATSLETSLTTIALSYWPFDRNPSSRAERTKTRKALLIAAFSCILRPTSGVMWIYLFFEHLITPGARIAFLQDCASIGVGAILLAAMIDGFYSGKWNLSILNFISINSSSVSQFYGKMPWHYYITQAIPLLSTTTLPFFIRGFYVAVVGASRPLRNISGLIIWTTLVYSSIPHKEWRFLHFLLPLFHILTAKCMVDMSLHSNNQLSRQLRIRPSFAIFTLLSVPVSLYVMFYHGQAQIAVLYHLRSLPSHELKSLGFLMPCHSTPMQSYLHRPELEDGLLWALGCEPPLNIADITRYRDQSDVFYESPVDYLGKYFPPHVDTTFPRSLQPVTPPGQVVGPDFRWAHTWPSHLVMFGALLREDNFTQLLTARGYRPVWSIGNGFEEDSRRREGVHIWRWESVASSADR